MKNLILLFCALFIMAVSSCKKEDGESATPLVGKWKLNATYDGTGGPGTWQIVVATDSRYIQFYADGKLGGFAGYNSYVVKDSLLTFKNATDGVQKYIHSIKRDTLILIPNGPPYCIEGCATRFIKEK